MEEKKWFKKWWGILLIVLLILLIAWTVYFLNLFFKYKKAMESGAIINNTVLGQYSIYNGDVEVPEARISREDLETIDDPSMGSENPVMTIVEFGDFSCSYCLLMHKVLRDFTMENIDKVKLIFRDFPLEEDYNRAIIANCSFDQGKFWQMHDKLFTYQDKINESLVLKFAKDLKLDLDEFNECRVNKSYVNDIENDFIIGRKAGVSGTPTLFINGEKFPGVLSRDILEQILLALEQE